MQALGLYREQAYREHDGHQPVDRRLRGVAAMRLVVFDDSRLGLLRDERVIDVSDLVGAGGAEWPPVFLLRAIAGFDRLRPRLEEAVGAAPASRSARSSSGHRSSSRTRSSRRPSTTAPTSRRCARSIKGELHAIEKYGVFLKAPSSVVGPGATVELPFPDRRTDHEVELGVVIGRTARDVAAADAMRYVFGYTGVMDITVRGEEDRSTRKSFDTFTPVGPVLVTADEIPDPHGLQLQLWVNGERRQNGNTRDMIWNVPRLDRVRVPRHDALSRRPLLHGHPGRGGPAHAGGRGHPGGRAHRSHVGEGGAAQGPERREGPMLQRLEGCGAVGVTCSCRCSSGSSSSCTAPRSSSDRPSTGSRWAGYVPSSRSSASRRPRSGSGSSPITEFFGGLSIMLGFLTRFWAAGLVIDMAVAMLKNHITDRLLLADPGGGLEFPLTLGVMALALVLMGPSFARLDRADRARATDRREEDGDDRRRGGSSSRGSRWRSGCCWPCRRRPSGRTGSRSAAPSPSPAASPATGAPAIIEFMKGWEKLVNAEGGVLVKEYNAKLPVELVLYDDESSPEKSVELYEKLNAVDKVHLFIGPGSSPITLRASTVAERLEDPDAPGRGQQPDHLRARLPVDRRRGPARPVLGRPVLRPDQGAAREERGALPDHRLPGRGPPAHQGRRRGRDRAGQEGRARRRGHRDGAVPDQRLLGGHREVQAGQPRHRLLGRLDRDQRPVRQAGQRAGAQAEGVPRHPPGARSSPSRSGRSWPRA